MCAIATTCLAGTASSEGARRALERMVHAKRLARYAKQGNYLPRPWRGAPPRSSAPKQTTTAIDPQMTGAAGTGTRQERP